MTSTEAMRQQPALTSEVDEPAPGKSAQLNRLASAVYRLDGWLRNRNGVFEYSNHPDCIFRIQIERLKKGAELQDRTCLAAGGRVITLHIWNEHIPEFSNGKPTLNWARKITRKLDFSMRELARYLGNEPELDDISIIWSEMTLGPPNQTPTLVQLSKKYGFEPLARRPMRRPGEVLHWLGENILISMLVLASNPAAWGWDDLVRDRTRIMMSRSKLMCLYGHPK